MGKQEADPKEGRVWRRTLGARRGRGGAQRNRGPGSGQQRGRAGKAGGVENEEEETLWSSGVLDCERGAGLRSHAGGTRTAAFWTAPRPGGS